MKRFHQKRTNTKTRAQWAEHTFGAEHFLPVLFIVPGANILRPVPGLQGTAHVSTDMVDKAMEPFLAAGIKRIMLFGSPGHEGKSPLAESSRDPQGLVPLAIRKLRAAYHYLEIYTDVCLCAYTDHGHCGLLTTSSETVQLDNDASLPLLAAMAQVHAEAGADWVAPSAMLDGQIEAIRHVLDHSGHGATKILGYSAKFASSFYGPFRGAAGSSPSHGDRRSYQMDPPNGKEALEEIEADLEEGADAVMVKPGLTYLDILARARDRWPSITLAAYHTSGEIMAIRAAAKAGIVDLDQALWEQHIALRRAGADLIIGYGASQALGFTLPWESTCHD